ncbi:sugar phosphate isomerase/epimerase family protein [Raineyella sp. W15-4]|uniref:sugar phosphate isomerase/epimerase family protein n=1 Tax=Raineyella sp. W15-4 TaxID=3081651 RepID=UPI0029544AEE|nr:sugar phosphate isomerase/epimerase family protein [Raineyella sp. W15-4]WOQ17104.1 sugar phosphate isomerase/epimerase family protein [Raineyella sp. W15-4]
MKIAVDPFSLRKQSLDDYFRRAAEAGFHYIEFSQRDDVWPYYTHPTANDEQVTTIKRTLKKYGLELASCLPLYRWSSPDEDERQAAVRYWLRAINITLDLGCHQMNSEFSGRPEQPERSEAQFWKSMDVILPRIEKEGIQLNLEPHPDDFIEDGIRAVDMIRAINSPNVGFLYCAPHTFHQGGNAGEIIRYAGKDLRHLHIADSFDHRASEGGRYISNPPGNPARIHQHNPIGLGEVDWNEFWQALRDVEFDGIATCALFSWMDTWDEDNSKTHDIMVERLGAITSHPEELR